MRIFLAVLVSAMWLACGAATAAEDPAARGDAGMAQETLAAPEDTGEAEAPPSSGEEVVEDTGASGGVEDEDATAEEVEQQMAEAGADERPAWDVAGYGNATAKSVDARESEAVAACDDTDRPPPGTMLSAGSITAGGGNRPWVVLAGAIAAAAALVAAGSYAVRRRRAPRPGQAAASRGPLETVTTILGIVSTIFGLAFLVAPDLAPDKSSGRDATMVVRDVEPRIPRGEYVDKTGSDARLAKVDRRELGNVVWLELGLRGYEGKRPVIQTTLHDPAEGFAMIKGSARETTLPAVAGQEETRFVPIWVGHPQSEKFEAHFRLVESGQVRELAGTDRMRAARYRYACDEYVEDLAPQR